MDGRAGGRAGGQAGEPTSVSAEDDSVARGSGSAVTLLALHRRRESERARSRMSSHEFRERGAALYPAETSRCASPEEQNAAG